MCLLEFKSGGSEHRYRDIGVDQSERFSKNSILYSNSSVSNAIEPMHDQKKKAFEKFS